jgi:hypothetical protein
MKILVWTISIMLGIVTLFAIIQTIASERVEVVELHTTDPQGEVIVTRLWVVDHDGFQYLRVGGDGSGWYSRLQDNKQIKLTRGNTTGDYLTRPRPEKDRIINELMARKYTWGDTFFATVFGSREGSIPIELQPIQTSGIE